MITEAELIGEVRQQAHAEPARVYKRSGVAGACLYRPGPPNRECGCIVGEALSALGLPDKVLARLDGADSAWEPTFGSSTGWGSDEAFGVLGEHLSTQAITSAWVVEVQGNQDRGMTWEDAVKAADAEARRQGWVLP